jgi:hypothetical protein
MPAERIISAINAVRDALPGLRKTSSPVETAGADHAKDQRGEMARRLGLEKERVIAQSSTPRIGPTRAI